MIFYCPNCWEEFSTDKQICPHCGEDLSTWGEKKQCEKLLRALSHPEPETQIRAVYLLGEKRMQEAVDDLKTLFKRSVNPFLQSEVIEALGKIDGVSAMSVLIEALRHPSFIVRGEAVKALARFTRNGDIQAALKRSLKDPSTYVREMAKAAIGVSEKGKKPI